MASLADYCSVVKVPFSDEEAMEILTYTSRGSSLPLEEMHHASPSFKHFPLPSFLADEEMSQRWTDFVCNKGVLNPLYKRIETLKRKRTGRGRPLPPALTFPKFHFMVEDLPYSVQPPSPVSPLSPKIEALESGRDPIADPVRVIIRHEEVKGLVSHEQPLNANSVDGKALDAFQVHHNSLLDSAPATKRFRGMSKATAA